MLNRRHFSIAAGATALSGFPAVHAQSDKIILGQSAAFTGPAAQLGIQFHAGAKLCFDQVNGQGGINGRSIEIRKLDDGYEPARCEENTQKLLADNVSALFGYVGTPTSLVALPLATKAKVPFFAPFTGAMALREPLNRHAFHIRASYSDETALIVKQLFNVGISKVAVFYQNDAYGKAGLDGVTAALAALKLKPVATATVERNSADVAKAVSTLAAATPEAIVQISTYQASAAFIRAARKAGYGGGFYNVSFVGTQALADELGKDGAGVVVTQVVPSPYVSTKGICREFADAVRKSNGAVQINFSSMEGYIAAKVLAEGLRRSGGKSNTDALITALESINGQPFGGFNVNFSHTNHAASSFVEMSMLTGDGHIRT